MCAAPTVTIIPLTGTNHAKGTAITSKDFGNIIAGEDSSVVALQWYTSGNSISTAVAWMSTDFTDAQVVLHNKVSTSWVDPSGQDVDSANFGATPTAETAGDSVDEETSNDDTVADSAYTEYYSYGIRTSTTATDGSATATLRLKNTWPFMGRPMKQTLNIGESMEACNAEAWLIPGRNDYQGATLRVDGIVWSAPIT